MRTNPAVEQSNGQMVRESV